MCTRVCSRLYLICLTRSEIRKLQTSGLRLWESGSRETVNGTVMHTPHLNCVNRVYKPVLSMG
jgi:hypothetical protein